MSDFCHCEVCGYPKAGIFDRCGLKVCADCSTKERWCPTVTLYQTPVQAWRGDTFVLQPDDLVSPGKSRRP